MKKIGMVGIGMMGLGIATNVQKAGYALSVLQHAGNQPLDDLITRGATVYKDARDLTADSEVLILCVTGSAQIEELFSQADGLYDGLQPGTVVIDCSTAIPSSSERIARLVEQKEAWFIDAPMTRTPKEAMQGRLNLLVGGDTTVFQKVRPLLESFAECITHVGPAGSGHRMKLLHNYVSLGTIALISEAMACADKAGMDRSVFIDVLENGGGNGEALRRMKAYLLSDDVSALRFAMSNAEKDLTYYTEMADEGACACTIGHAVRATFNRAVTASPDSLVLELSSILADDKG